ncbi:hypothetical protein TpMuguga_04g00589 [Theileria parva strain Muguga]|nr:uncharacterized protein TpMuguga_04g00589 [Theileria parva strain Muguga]EAN31941.2 hypothetical protein TpMuguga_04g00589 [Theileria parva strain Muguga]
MEFVSGIFLVFWCSITGILCNIKASNLPKFNNNHLKLNNYRKYNYNYSFVTSPVNIITSTKSRLNALNNENTAVLTEKSVNTEDTNVIVTKHSDRKILPLTLNLVKPSDKLKYIKTKCENIKVKIYDLLYPKDCSPEVLKFINYKHFERFLLSFYSAITMNIKFNNTPETVAKSLEENSVKSGNKVLTMFTSLMFKDFFGKVINYYWFNKVNLSSFPRFYRISSTVIYSVLGLLDSVINYKLLEPKTVLFAINNVFKQLSLLTLNNLNNLYTQEKNLVVRDNNYIFDLLGMSLGLLVSHLLNKFDTFKFTTVITNFIANNLTSYYITTLK